MEEKKKMNSCVNVEVTQANAPMELQSTFTEGTFKTVRIVLENGHVLQAAEGSKYYNLFCRAQAGDIISYTWEKQEPARAAERTLPTGEKAPAGYNGSLSGLVITEWEASEIEDKFANIMARPEKEAVKRTAKAKGEAVPEYKETVEAAPVEEKF